MNVVIAIDSFKGSMSSVQAGRAAADGVKRVIPDAEVFVKPIADGGEGTVESLVEGLNGTLKEVTVKNLLGREITCQYGIIGDTAIVEMAQASGIALIKKEELNPMETTTYGVGEILKDAILSGCRKFIIGIGGSATNDCGIGMLQALGYEFIDRNGNEVPFGAKALDMITEIRDDNAMKELKECSFNIACDVKNPLCGENGCSVIFAPQKGVTQDMVKAMDKAMEHYSKVVSTKYINADKNFPGAGAAGGLGFAFMTFLGGKLQSGIELILDKISIEKSIMEADLVITGEGKIDSQTVMGKAPIGIARLAKKHNKPVIAFSGCVTRDASVCNSHGIDAVFPIVRSACTLEEAMDCDNAYNNMADCAEQVMRLWQVRI